LESDNTLYVVTNYAGLQIWSATDV